MVSRFASLSILTVSCYKISILVFKSDKTPVRQGHPVSSLSLISDVIRIQNWRVRNIFWIPYSTPANSNLPKPTIENSKLQLKGLYSPQTDCQIWLSFYHLYHKIDLQPLQTCKCNRICVYCSKIDGFENPSLEIDGFGRTHRTRPNDITVLELVNITNWYPILL